MSVCFGNFYELKEFLARAGIEVSEPQDDDKHYIIIGHYSGLALGCCSGSGRMDILFEEEEATFEEVKKDECPICSAEE